MLLEGIVYKWLDINIYATKPVLENYEFLVHIYYAHPGYQTSIFGKNCAHYIRIFTVCYVHPQSACMLCNATAVGCLAAAAICSAENPLTNIYRQIGTGLPRITAV